MKKAQNLIEVSLVLVLVIVVSLTTWSLFNKQTKNLVKASNVKVKTIGTLPIKDPPKTTGNPKLPVVAGNSSH